MTRDSGGNSTRQSSAVVIFTLTFPFGRGEEFLEAEIPQLLQVFDKVVVVPTTRSPVMRQTRVLSDNVTLVDVNIALPRLATLFAATRPAALARSAARALTATSPIRILTDLKFDAYSSAIAHRAAPAVKNAVRDATEVIFYSYWLHVPARVAVETQRIVRRRDSPVVSRANGFDLYAERSRRGYLPQRPFLLKRLTHVFPASAAASRYLRDRYPSIAWRVSTERIGTPGATNAGNADQEKRHIVSCSYIAPVKRLTMLIDDLAEAQRRTQEPLFWTHIGSGQHDYEAQVVEYAAAKLPAGSFQFLGHLESQELRAWYAQNPASAFVQVSESEGGLAASIQEALAQGIPVIATDVGGVSALRDGKGLFDGLLPKDHTPSEFAERLEAVLNADPTTYTGHVQASMAFWHAECSAETLASAFARRLRSMARDFERTSRDPS